MPLKRLSLDDSLGIASSHFFKSGNLVRSKESEALVDLKNLLPKTGPEKTRIEYDINYDLGGKDRVHGYTYTDSLGKFLYLRPANDYLKNKIMCDSVLDQKITDEGEKIFEDILQNSSDKYSLRKIKQKHKFVIFLPGSNIYDKIVDESKVKTLIEKNSAVVKCHPITNPVLFSKLKNLYGEDNVIHKKYSGHELLESCEEVGFSYNSEIGILSLVKNKKLYHIGKEKDTYTYSAIYNSIFDAWELGHFGENDSFINRLKCLLSCEYNGFVSKYSKEPKLKINKFFNYFKGYEHVRPRNRD